MRISSVPKILQRLNFQHLHLQSESASGSCSFWPALLHCYTVSWQLWLWQPSKFTGGFINKKLHPSSSGKAIGEVAIVLTSGETVIFWTNLPDNLPVSLRRVKSPNCVGFSFADSPFSSSSIWKYIMGRFLPEILHKSRPRIWFFEATCGQNGNLALPNNTQHNTQDLQLSSISTLRSQVREKAWLKICFCYSGVMLPKLSLFPEKKGHFYKNMFVCHTKIQSAHVTSPCKVCIPYIENKGFAPSSTALCLFARLFWVVVHNLKWDYYTSIKMGISLSISYIPRNLQQGPLSGPLNMSV